MKNKLIIRNLDDWQVKEFLQMLEKQDHLDYDKITVEQNENKN